MGAKTLVLTDISIKNFLTIESCQLQFKDALTVLTGETGAGKSIFIDSLRIALGAKASCDMVRKNTQQAEIVAEFKLTELPHVIAWLRTNDLVDLEQEDYCAIKRIIPSEGRTRVYINGSSASLGQLLELAPQLLQVHGQHAQQGLMSLATQRKLFDRCGEHEKLAQQTQQAFTAWHQQEKVLLSLKDEFQQRKEKLELLSYQVSELDELGLIEDEWAELDARQKRLSNQDAIKQSVEKALYHIDGGLSSNASVRQVLEITQADFIELESFEPGLKLVNNELQQAIIHLEETISELKALQNDSHDDARELAQIEERIQSIMQFARKHQVKPELLLQHHQALTGELTELNDFSPRIEQLVTEVEALKTQYVTNASKLSRERKSYAKVFASEVEPHLKNLGMTHAEFKVEIEALDEADWGIHGMEQLSYQVKTNPEQSFHLISDIASGGELSRISLAIEAISAEQMDTPTFVFDEIDVGVGGTTAKTIGQLLRKIAEHKQILCITHLPQVAVYGQNHIKIEKSVYEGMTYSRLGVLSDDERLHEVGRMLGTKDSTEASLSYAESLFVLD